ncbi:hypothetical protein D3C78_1540960 [compost metagenome]
MISCTLKRPLVMSSTARPNRRSSPSTAVSRLSRRSSSNASSLMVPGVMMRTTWRSTGPLLVAGSPICSQITTDSPSLTSLAR